jgi:hypothetical protein
MTDARPLDFLPPFAKQILLPSVAGSTAVCFTHPMDLTKVRLQLDNEMAKKGSPRAYKVRLTSSYICANNRYILLLLHRV